MTAFVRVAAGIIWKDGLLLVACRPTHKPRGGFWEFPGGKQEVGESMQETLARELLEELGIRVMSAQLWQVREHAYPDLRVELHFIHVHAFEGEPQSNDGQELRWVTPIEAQLMNFLPADIAVVAELLSLG